MPLEQVVFDIDHTFGRFLRVQLKKFQVFETVGSQHLKIPPEQVRQLLKEHNNLEGIDNSFVLQGIPVFREFYFDPNHEKEMWELIYSCKDISNIYSKPYPGVLETMSTLKHNNIKIAVWSDAPWFKGVSRLIRMGLPDSFTVICAMPTKFDYHELYTPQSLKPYVDKEISQIRAYGENIIQVLHNQKPHLEGLERIVAVTSIHPENMMMVGDNVVKDYRVQEAAGMCAVLAKVDEPSEEDYELLYRYIDCAANKPMSTEGQTEEGINRQVKKIPEILYYVLEQNKQLVVKSQDRTVLYSILSKFDSESQLISLSRTVNVKLGIVEFHLAIVTRDAVNHQSTQEMKNIKLLPILLDSITGDPVYFSKHDEKVTCYK